MERVAASVVMMATVDPHELGNLGVINKENISERILKSFRYISYQALSSYSDRESKFGVSVLSIEQNHSDPSLIDIAVKVRTMSLLINELMYEIAIDVAFKDFLCYFDKMGWTIIESAMASYLWYQGGLTELEVTEQLNGACETCDKVYEVCDAHNKIEYVFYRDSMNMSLNDYEIMVGDFNDQPKR